jgi:hypothetical protein
MENNPYGSRPITRGEEALNVFLSPTIELKQKALERILLDPKFPAFLRGNVRRRAKALGEKGGGPRGLFEWLIEALGFEDIPREHSLRELPPQAREKARSLLPPKKRPRDKGRPGKPFRNLDVVCAVNALRARGLSERKAAGLVAERLFLTLEAVRSILKREGGK